MKSITQNPKGIKAENSFRNFISKNKPHLQVTKKGLPDFMIIKKGKVVGFVEVKRDDWNDKLRKEQVLFKDFCRDNNIPYQVWSPLMDTKWWKNRKKKDRLKRDMTYGGEIWNKI